MTPFKPLLLLYVFEEGQTSTPFYRCYIILILPFVVFINRKSLFLVTHTGFKNNIRTILLLPALKKQLWRSRLNHNVTYFKTRNPPLSRKTYYCLHQVFHPHKFYRQIQSPGLHKFKNKKRNPRTMKATESRSTLSILKIMKSCQSPNWYRLSSLRLCRLW